MSDLGYGTEVAEPPGAPGPDAGDDSWHGEDSPPAVYGGAPGAFTAEDQLPARQETRTDTWDDDPDYDDDWSAGYDGDLEALTVGDQLPPRQDSHASTWGDDPEYGDEADPGSGYDDDLDSLTADDHALDAGPGDQDQDAEDPGPPDAGSWPDTGAAETGVGDQPHDESADSVTEPPVQADDGRARPENALEADLRELKAEYEASLAELRSEVQSLREYREATSDGPGDTGRDAGQRRAAGLPVEQIDPEVAANEHDRPGFWSNAKTAVYGVAGSAVTATAMDAYLPGLPHPVVDIAAGVVATMAALVPAMREGWRRERGNSPDNPRR